MSCIVYQTDKRTGIKYADESVSYWDKDKKQPRSKRKYLGKVDPVSGKIITSQSKKRSLTRFSQEENDACEPDIMQLQKELLEKDVQIETLRKELESSTARCRKADLLFQLKLLKDKVAAFESGEKYVRMQEEYRKNLAFQNRRNGQLEKELACSRAETASVRNKYGSRPVKMC